MKCQNESCKKHAIFGLEQGKPLVCSCHWEEGVRDVIQKKCQNEGCEKVSTFGLQSRKPLFCVSHCEEGMLDVIHKKCRTERCEKIPIFSLEQGKPLVCSCHHEEGMLDVIHKKCQTEGCDKITSNRKYKGHCLHCFMHLFPQEKISRNYKIDLQRDWSEQPYHWTILFNYCNARQTHSRWLFSKATWHSYRSGLSGNHYRSGRVSTYRLRLYLREQTIDEIVTRRWASSHCVHSFQSGCIHRKWTECNIVFYSK